MSATDQFTTYQDLYTGVMNQVRANVSQTTPNVMAKRAVNVALQDMHLGTDYQFYWAERDTVLLTAAPYSTGTISIIPGNSIAVGVGTDWETATVYGPNNVAAGGKMVIGSDQTVYSVTSTLNATTVQLGSDYVGEAVSAGTYTYFQDTYELASDFLRPVDLQFFDDDRSIRIVDRKQLRRAFPRNSRTGRPRLATKIELGPSGSTALRPRLVLAPPPDAVYQIPYSYLTNKLVVAEDGTLKTGFTADSDEPIVPLRYRHAIYYYALAIVYEHKDDVRRAEAMQHYRDVMQRTLQDVAVGDRRTRIEPQVSHYASRAERPYHGGRNGRVWDFNDEFDRRI